jgi:hypothetical protein
MYLIPELWDFVKTRKKFWLLPIVVTMVLVGPALVFAEGRAKAPFVYTLF